MTTAPDKVWVNVYAYAARVLLAHTSQRAANDALGGAHSNTTQVAVPYIRADLVPEEKPVDLAYYLLGYLEHDHNRMPPCATCDTKPGSPVLCERCLSNRSLISRVHRALVKAERPTRWKWVVKNGDGYARPINSVGGFTGLADASGAHDFGSKEAAQDFVRKNWGRVVKRRVRA